MRSKVLSVTRECCHYLATCQGNSANSLLKQINANFQVIFPRNLSSLLSPLPPTNDILFEIHESLNNLTYYYSLICYDWVLYVYLILVFSCWLKDCFFIGINGYMCMVAGNCRGSSYEMRVPFHLLREEQQWRLGQQSLLEKTTLHPLGVLRAQWNMQRPKGARSWGNHSQFTANSISQSYLWVAFCLSYEINRGIIHQQSKARIKLTQTNS